MSPEFYRHELIAAENIENKSIMHSAIEVEGVNRLSDVCSEKGYLRLQASVYSIKLKNRDIRLEIRRFLLSTIICISSGSQGSWPFSFTEHFSQIFATTNVEFPRGIPSHARLSSGYASHPYEARTDTLLSTTSLLDYSLPGCRIAEL